MLVAVVGLRYYKFRMPKFDEQVKLTREVENRHDKKAVAVFNKRGEKIGYVAKQHNCNEHVYKLIKGQSINGKVYNIFKSIMVVIIKEQ